MASELLTKKEAAAFCRVCLRTFERKVQPFLPFVMIGSKMLVERKDLDAWVASRKVDAHVVSLELVAPGAAARSPRADAILYKLRTRRVRGRS